MLVTFEELSQSIDAVNRCYTHVSTVSAELLFNSQFSHRIKSICRLETARMGRNRFAKRKRARREGRDDVKKPDLRSEPYKEIVRENDAFVKYYRHLGICPESEWDAFLHAIKSDLPATFRITGCRNAAKKLLNLIQNQFFTDYVAASETDAAENGETKSDSNLKKPFCLPWYPNDLGWQLELTRKDIRRSEAFYKLHNFLIAETSAGSISRQEAVSMIPPLVLDVQPHHKVLDMCAAPGSKTAQLIEALHADETKPVPTGFVVANDIDNNRCYMLVHQAKRLNSPCFVVTNHDSSAMPQMYINQNEKLKFDRVLCDVPCSGDGTLRKNPDIWTKWNQGHALNLHGIQFRVARRGAELLNVGGRLVYSTCSLNPVENEAVLHRLIKESEGALELIDASDLVPGLKFTAGLSHWELSPKEIEFYKTFDEVPEKYHTIIRPQMFPPTAEEANKIGLEKCMRLLPHYQNTGAFFVGVLVKKSLMPWERKEKEEAKTAAAEEEKPADANGNGNDVDTAAPVEDDKSVPWGPQRKKRRLHGYKEDPYVFFGPDEPIWNEIKEFYEIDQPRDVFDPTCLLTRCVGGKKKNLYFCSQAVKDLVQNNENSIKIINTGVKAFVRCDNRNMKCQFRLANEGLACIREFIGKSRRINISKDDLILLLQNTEIAKPPPLDQLSKETYDRVQEVGAGSCLLVYKEDDEFTMTLVGWRGTSSLRAYTETSDSVHMLRLLGADVSKYVVNKFQKAKDALAAAAAGAAAATEQAGGDSNSTSDAAVENGDENTVDDVEMD